MGAKMQTISGSFVLGNTTTNTFIMGENHCPIGFSSGSTLNGTTMTFLVSDSDSGPFLPLYDDNSIEVSLTITTAARAYRLDPLDFWPWSRIKLRLGTSASAVAATSTTAVSLYTRDI
jgi:hypothetical protein